MRQIVVQVPRAQGARAVEIAARHGATNLVRLSGEDANANAVDLVLANVENARVERFVGALGHLQGLHLSFVPQGVLALRPPQDETPDQVTDVSSRSPVEIFLGGLQSVGSWTGFLGYAAAAGVTVWIALFTNTPYLLVAAMLIAPFAGPAMNLALGSARGDAKLIGRGILRYFAALALSIGVAFMLSLIFRQEVATTLMLDQSQVSGVAVLLPLTAGFAGALNLVQSERSSLVSGAATGVLVAASLAPPAGVVGIASAMGEWRLVQSGAFLLLLQLAGINLAAALLFRCSGLSSRGARYERGRRWVLPASLTITAAGLGGLLTWQFSDRPALQRPSIAQRATAQAKEVIEASELVDPIEVDLRFTRADVVGQNSLLGVAYVQRRKGVGAGDEEIERQLTKAIQDALRAMGEDVVPLVDVVVLHPPES
jgi:uncharacterized hydrophobic protein (TIGR00271 family)